MTTFDLAMQYYPRLWSIDRLRALVAAEKLTEAEYQQITGDVYIA